MSTVRLRINKKIVIFLIILFSSYIHSLTQSEGNVISVGDTVIKTSYSREEYALQLNVGQTVTVDLQSEDWDTYLEIFNNGLLVAADDDGGTGLNSLLIFTAPSTGTYVIRVRRIPATGIEEAAGAFRLSVFASNSILPAAIPTATLPLLRTAQRNADWTPIEQNFDGVTMVLVPSGCIPDDKLYSIVPGAMPDTLGPLCFEQPYWIDKYEVTQDLWRRYRGDRWFTAVGGNRPADYISLQEARSFCETRGARLPINNEWHYAAAGPDFLPFPWGDTIRLPEDHPRTHRGTFGGNWPVPQDVGSHPLGASWVGALDMIGNVGEWVTLDPSIIDPAYGFLRGGTYFNDPLYLSNSYRDLDNTQSGDRGTGFRCVRDVNPYELTAMQNAENMATAIAVQAPATSTPIPTITPTATPVPVLNWSLPSRYSPVRVDADDTGIYQYHTGLVSQQVNMADQQSDCVGWTESQPTQTYIFTGPSPSSVLRFYAIGWRGADVTLAVRSPDGTFRCNNNSFGTIHPSVDIPDPQDGEYYVWVGSAILDWRLFRADVFPVMDLTSHP